MTGSASIFRGLAALVLAAWPALAGGPAVAAQIELLAPGPGTVWTEGETVQLRWSGGGTEPICIALHAGGKDLGLINDCDTPAEAGRYAWTVPVGRVTGFGPDHFDNVQVGLWPADGSGPMVESAPFAIAGFVPGRFASAEAAIRGYFAALDSGDLRRAYALLNPFRIELQGADGAGRLAFRPRPDFATWEAQTRGWLSGARVLALEDVSGRMRWFRDAPPALGIRLFSVKLALTHPDGRESVDDLFIYVARGYLAGSDAAPVFRLLEIGTGP